MPFPLSAIILSAGSSKRMGQPKALLNINNKSFLHHIIDTIEISGIEDIIVVLGSEATTIQRSIETFKGKIIINNAWQSGQLSSIIEGLSALKESNCKGILIWPSDHPLISPVLIKKLIDEFLASKSSIVVPKYLQQRGHPIIIANNLFEEVTRAQLDFGLRSVVHAHEDDIREVETNEEGVLINIDTPEDYQRYILQLSR